MIVAPVTLDNLNAKVLEQCASKRSGAGWMSKR